MDDKTKDRILGFPYIVSYIHGIVAITAMLSGNGEYVGNICTAWLIMLIAYVYFKYND